MPGSVLMLIMMSSVFFLLQRVILKKGVAFLGARPSAPFLWSVTQEERREGQKLITLQCSRSDPGFGRRSVPPRASLRCALFLFVFPVSCFRRITADALAVLCRSLIDL